MPRPAQPTSLAGQARAAGLTPRLVYQRLYIGWSLEQALTQPRISHRMADAVGQYLTRQAAADLAWSAALLVGAALVERSRPCPAGAS